MSSPPRKIRLGLLVDDLIQPRWVADMLAEVERSGVAETVLIVRNTAPKEPQNAASRLWEKRKTLLYSLYLRIDRRLFPNAHDPFTPTALDQSLAAVPVWDVVPQRTKHVDRFEPVDIERIKQAEVDVLLRLGFRILKGPILTAARAGVWSLHHGDARTQRGGPAGVWEVFHDSPITGAMLQILTERLDAGVILAETWGATQPLSVNRNHANLYIKSARLLPRELVKLQRLGVEHYLQQAHARQPVIDLYDRPVYTTPTNGQVIRYGAAITARYLVRKWKSLWTREQWLLLHRRGTEPIGVLSSFKKLEPPRDRFWADPHLAIHEGRPYLFLEELPFATNRGHIAVTTLNERGEWTTPQPVLERPYHLSYPFVFRHNKQWYLLPETAGNRTVEVYCAVEFPHRWELHRTLLRDVQAVDATLHHDGTRWWMFVNQAAAPGASTWDELHLYWSDDPLSENWTPHPLNPIVSDVRRARPAGPLFTANGQLIRPAQDCSGCYGRGLKFMRVETLTTTEYRESELSAVYPEWDRRLFAVHSWTAAHGIQVTDADRRVFRWW